MTYKELMNPHLKKKPRFYDNHSKLLRQSMLEPQAISLYLHENMLNFFDNVEDIANCWETYSDLDGQRSKLEYQFGNQQYLQEIDGLNSLIESMAITEFNLHGADFKDSHRSSKKPQMLQMQAP